MQSKQTACPRPSATAADASGDWTSATQTRLHSRQGASAVAHRGRGQIAGALTTPTDI